MICSQTLRFLPENVDFVDSIITAGICNEIICMGSLLSRVILSRMRYIMYWHQHDAIQEKVQVGQIYDPVSKVKIVLSK